MAEVPPPAGRTPVTGVVRASQERAPIGPTEPEGRLEVVARIDLERLDRQFDDLIPVWIQDTSAHADALPVRLRLPETDDAGPHLAYAIQWYSFAAIGAIGYGLLIRKTVR